MLDNRAAKGLFSFFYGGIFVLPKPARAGNRSARFYFRNENISLIQDCEIIQKADRKFPEAVQCL
jgi:hypothetical protein